MIIVWILLAALVVLLVLLGIALVHTYQLKPTSAIDAPFPDCDLERAQTYAETLSRMVQCETISHFGQTDRTKFYEFHKLLRSEFPTLHTVAEPVVLNGSLLYKVSGKNATLKPIMLMSHQDVVAAEGQWKHEPFSGTIAEGVVWGRGTLDTKGSLFCFMQAVEELLNAGWKPDCDVYLASSCTEEWAGDGAPATAAYLKEKGVHLGMLLDEGGVILDSPMAGVRGRYGMVGVIEKGYADVKFIAKSGGGHASAPSRNSSLVRLAKLMCKIEKRSPFTARFTPTLREMFARMAPNMSFPMRFLFGNLWLFEPLLVVLIPRINTLAGAMLRTTCAFTTAKGSDGLNVMPAEAYVTANMRCMPFQPTGESIAIMEKLAAKLNIETEVLYHNEPPTPVSYKSAPFKLLEDTLQKVYPGYGIVPYIMTGCTDCRFYSEVTDHALRFAPLQINAEQFEGVHGLNENVSVLALPPAVDFYREVLTSWAGPVEEKPVETPQAAETDRAAAAKPAAVENQPAETEPTGEDKPAPKAKRAAKPKKPVAAKPAAVEKQPAETESAGEDKPASKAKRAAKPKKPAAAKPAAVEKQPAETESAGEEKPAPKAKRAAKPKTPAAAKPVAAENQPTETETTGEEQPTETEPAAASVN